MSGMLKHVLAEYEEQVTPQVAELYVEEIMERLEGQARCTRSTACMDSRVRDAVKAALIGKGCTVEWNGRQLKVTAPPKEEPDDTE